MLRTAPCSFLLSSLKHVRTSMQACVRPCFATDLYTKKAPPGQGRGLKSRYHPYSRNIKFRTLLTAVTCRHVRTYQRIFQRGSSGANLRLYRNLRELSAWDSPSLLENTVILTPSQLLTTAMIDVLQNAVKKKGGKLCFPPPGMPFPPFDS